MDPTDEDVALSLLTAAARDAERVDTLPDSGRPASVAEALAMQARLVARLGEPVGGFKVATDPSGKAMWGAILQRDILPTPATIGVEAFAPVGIEGEIAFRFDRALPSRAKPYARSEIEEAVTALPVIEIVSSRFRSYQDTPLLDRLVDRMSNGALVIGEARPDWRSIDLSNLPVTLTCDGETLIHGIGGHSRGDPLLSALDFIHAVQSTRDFGLGEIITTGTFTGLIFGRPGQQYAVAFHGFGRVEVVISG